MAAALAVAAIGVVVAVVLASGNDSSPSVQNAAQTLSAAQTVVSVRTVVSPTPKRPPHPHKAVPVVTVPSTPVSHVSSATDKAEIRNVLSQHWADIESGNYDAAFNLLVPGSQSHDAWVSAHVQDALTSASIDVGDPTISSSTTATAPVINLHTEASSGCFNWSGYYEMSKIAGSWRIGKAKISRSSC